jgi:hypothetical protein
MRITGHAQNNTVLTSNELHVDDGSNNLLIKSMNISANNGQVAVLKVERYIRPNEIVDYNENGLISVIQGYNEGDAYPIAVLEYAISDIEVGTLGRNILSIEPSVVSRLSAPVGRTGRSRNPAVGSPVSEPISIPPEPKPEPAKPKEFPSPIPDLEI